jgi:hypothetical protein
MQAALCVGVGLVVVGLVELEVVDGCSGGVIVSEGGDELDVGEAGEVDSALFGIGDEVGLCLILVIAV